MDTFCPTRIASISRSSFRIVTSSGKACSAGYFLPKTVRESRYTFYGIYPVVVVVGGAGDTPLFGLVRGCTAAQGMSFDLSVLNMAYNFVRVCPRQGI